jgi:hypothetical protein
VHRAQFVGAQFAVVIRIRLIEECDVALMLRLKLGPTNRPIAIGIQSTQHPAHHRMTRARTMTMPMAMPISMPTRTVVIHRNPHALRFDDAVGPGFGPAFSAGIGWRIGSSIGSNFGCLGAGPRCQQQCARNHVENRPTHRQSLRILGRCWVVLRVV